VAANKKWDVDFSALFQYRRMSKTQTPDLVTLEYQIAELPSSQHRAGLAGLILKIQWLQQQQEFIDTVETIFKIINLDADKVTLQFNLTGLTLLLRSHYSANFEDRERTNVRTQGHQNHTTIQREIYNSETDRTELATFYVYQDIVPQGYLVQSFDPTANSSQIWTKLWQEATWGILRPRSNQRLPFKAMVSGTDPPEIEKIWNLLRDRPDEIVSLSSTYMLGVQSKNNEGIMFDDRARCYFLLNFWSYIVQIYIPIQVDTKDKVKFHGYAIAIPDVRNLASFCEYFPSIQQQRSNKIKMGKPDGAIVRHPIEASLVFLRSIHTYLGANTDDTDIDDLLFCVDVFHIFRKKDEPQILSIQRYPPDVNKIEEFAQLEHKIFDPTFRLQYWENLVHDRPRITGFDKLLWDLPSAKTISNKWFCRDFRTLFSLKYNLMEPEIIDVDKTNDLPESTETSVPQETSLENLVLRLLKTYTRHKLKEQFGIEWNKDWDRDKSEIWRQDAKYQAYTEKRKLVVRDLHNDFRRHRHPNEFLAYFANKFTGIYQYLSTKEYLLLAEQIQSQPERVQILCLLALPVLC
jgi:CRISPR-associated protein Cmx8